MGKVTVVKKWYNSQRSGDGSIMAEGIFEIQLSNPYAAGGDALDLSPYFKSIVAITPIRTEDTGNHVISVDTAEFATPAVLKAIANDISNGAESSGDLQLIKCYLKVLGY